MAGFVLTDASPLIGLARVDGLGWLKPLFGQVWVVPEVWGEVMSGSGRADELPLAQALASGWLRLAGHTPTDPPLPELDEGEAACIRLALQHRNNTGGAALLLMDERAGRAIALERGLRVAGTAAVIGMARSQGLIASARTVFARLHASDFRISAEVIATVLRRVGE